MGHCYLNCWRKIKWYLNHSLPLAPSTAGGCINNPFLLNIEAVVRRCTVKKMFWRMSQNSLENIIKFFTGKPTTLLKSRPRHKCFPVNVITFFRIFFQIAPLNGCFGKCNDSRKKIYPNFISFEKRKIY